MFAIIRAPRTHALELESEIIDLRKAYRAVVGTDLSPSGVLFKVERVSIDEVTYLLDQFRQPYAITSKGILRRNGDHIIMEFSYTPTENSGTTEISAFVDSVENDISHKEPIRKLVDAARYGL